MRSTFLIAAAIAALTRAPSSGAARGVRDAARMNADNREYVAEFLPR